MFGLFRKKKTEKFKEFEIPPITIRSYHRSEAQRLSSEAMYAFSDKNYSEADRLYLQSLKLSSNAIDRHFTYNGLIELTYRMRNEWPDALERCISYCLADIKFLPEFSHEYLKQFPNDRTLPRIPAFLRLAIIYEKHENYAEAIAICELALKYGQHDDTKSGYIGRIERLRKKLT